MPDVFPRSNLPDLAIPWGRAHDDRVLALESGLEIVTQSVQGQNRNAASSLAVIAAQVQKIADQQETLIAQQAELASQQAQLSSQQATLTATVNFLATQTVSDSKDTSDFYSGSPGGLSWMGYNATFDCAVAVTTGSAGRLVIQASSNLLSSGLAAIIGIEIVGITGPSWPGPYSMAVTATSAAAAGSSRTVLAALAPNTTYTVRLRRGVSGTSGDVQWGSQTLVVTRS